LRGAAWIGLAVAAALVSACGASTSHIPTPPGGARPVGPETVLGFHERAQAFYDRLLYKRFNALETFNDPFLRRHFASEDLFFDYYATLAEAFQDAKFERSRPWSVEVEEYVFEGPGRVVVQVRFRGDDNRPLRPDSSTFVRRDVWERREDTWWIIPSKL
jgi:hypothetical protein